MQILLKNIGSNLNEWSSASLREENRLPETRIKTGCWKTDFLAVKID